MDWAWMPQLSGWGLALALVFGGALVLLSWSGSRGLGRGKRITLLSLRLAAVLGLFLVIAGPQRVLTKERGQREPLAVLIDASRSMRVEDAGRGTRAEALGLWLKDRLPEFEELGREFDLQFFLLGDELRAWGGSGSGEPSPAADSGSDIGTALYALREALGGRRPAGVMLISDGADRSALGRAEAAGGTEAVLELLKGYGSPVSTWTLGDRVGLSDLSLAEVHAPPFGFVRRPLRVGVDLRRSGLPEAAVRVELYGEGEVLAVQDVLLDSEGKGELQFELRPDRIGYHSYRLVTEVPEGDVIPSNNHIEFTVKVVRDRTRVLQVTSRPSWDVKFLRRLLKTDPNIDLVSFFILRTSDYAGDLARREPLSLIAFPYDDLFTKDLQGFDLVIFQNFWFGSFANFSDEQFLGNIARFVEEGGALMMIGGDLTGEADYGNSPLAAVLPALLPRSVRSGEGRPAVVTDAGLRHPVTRLARNAQDNAERWKRLPLLKGQIQSGPVADDSVTLLRSGAGGDPLLSVRSVGRGRTLLFTSDSSWRWALANVDDGGAGRDHATLWRNAIRWLVKDAEERQVQVVTDRENYQLGDEISVQVRVLGADYAPRVGEQVHLRVRRVGSERLLHSSEGLTDAAGEVSLSLKANPAGTHAIEATLDSISGPFGSAEARITVLDRDGELEDPGTQPTLMAAIAKATGGHIFESDRPDPRMMTFRRTEVLFTTQSRSVPLWDQGWCLGLLGLALGLEWVLRRRIGLS
jgi:uncharacterized membrane protein